MPEPCPRCGRNRIEVIGMPPETPAEQGDRAECPSCHWIGRLAYRHYPAQDDTVMDMRLGMPRVACGRCDATGTVHDGPGGSPTQCPVCKGRTYV